MYTQNKDELNDIIDVLQDSLDDAWTWDAHHDDVLNDELGEIQEKINEIK